MTFEFGLKWNQTAEDFEILKSFFVGRIFSPPQVYLLEVPLPFKTENLQVFCFCINKAVKRALACRTVFCFLTNLSKDQLLMQLKKLSKSNFFT